MHLPFAAKLNRRGRAGHGCQTDKAAPDAESLPAALHSQSAWPYLACSNCSESRYRLIVQMQLEITKGEQSVSKGKSKKAVGPNMTINLSHMHMSHDVCSWTSVKLQDCRDKLPPKVENW